MFYVLILAGFFVLAVALPTQPFAGVPDPASPNWPTLLTIPRTGEHVPLPVTDADAERLLDYHDATVTKMMRSIYHVYRQQGHLVLEAYGKTLADLRAAWRSRTAPPRPAQDKERACDAVRPTLEACHALESDDLVSGDGDPGMDGSRRSAQCHASVSVVVVGVPDSQPRMGQLSPMDEVKNTGRKEHTMTPNYRALLIERADLRNKLAYHLPYAHAPGSETGDCAYCRPLRQEYDLCNALLKRLRDRGEYDAEPSAAMLGQLAQPRDAD